MDKRHKTNKLSLWLSGSPKAFNPPPIGLGELSPRAFLMRAFLRKEPYEYKYAFHYFRNVNEIPDPCCVCAFQERVAIAKVDWRDFVVHFIQLGAFANTSWNQINFKSKLLLRLLQNCCHRLTIRSSFLCLDDNFVEAFLSSFPTGPGITEEIRRSSRKCTILGELFEGFDMNRPL